MKWASLRYGSFLGRYSVYVHIVYSNKRKYMAWSVIGIQLSFCNMNIITGYSRNVTLK